MGAYYAFSTLRRKESVFVSHRNTQIFTSGVRMSGVFIIHRFCRLGLKPCDRLRRQGVAPASRQPS